MKNCVVDVGGSEKVITVMIYVPVHSSRNAQLGI